MTEVEQPPQNGIDLSAAEDDDSSKARPADIEQDMREMERRKRVEAIMGSKLFREELERIVDSAREGGTSGILQHLSDIVGLPVTRVGNVFKTSNCMVPINDIRGVESMGYAKGEKILRCKLAATFRLLDLYGWTQGLGAQITARLKVDQEYFLVNPYGLLYHEITASALNKVDMQGNIVEQGTTNFGVNKSHFVLHSVVHAARPDIRCAIYIGCSPVVAISSLKSGLLPLTKDACVLGEITNYAPTGTFDEEERDKLVRNLGPNSKVILLANHGALCCGETIEEAFFAACHIVQACETQLKLLPVGVDNLVLIPEETRKIIYDKSRRPPEDLEKKFNAALTTVEESNDEGAAAVAAAAKTTSPKWRVGGAEFEALMRMLDNAGYRTGYIYRHPLIKSDPPKPKNDVELPPAVSSLGYLLEEEELFRQGIWKKGDLRKGGDRSRWLNSPNVYQKVEVLETGTPDPKKITKWVAEGSPTHSTPVRIEDPLQFVPTGTSTKEFKRLQQQIKDNRRADKISAGPQSHILEGVTWDEANRIKDATVSQAGDHVVLMGAASKGIIQRGFQHNATVYKAPYAKNPFDNVTDDELNEYKRTVERKKKSIHGEYTDTDFSESEALSSLQTSGAQQTKQTTTTTTAAVSQSEPETSEHQVLRIETQQAPVPSQAEVVLSDATLSFINGERSHTATNRKPPTGRDNENETIINQEIQKKKNKKKFGEINEVDIGKNIKEDRVDVGSADNDDSDSDKENSYDAAAAATITSGTTATTSTTLLEESPRVRMSPKCRRDLLHELQKESHYKSKEDNNNAEKIKNSDKNVDDINSEVATHISSFLNYYPTSRQLEANTILSSSHIPYATASTYAASVFEYDYITSASIYSSNSNSRAHSFISEGNYHPPIPKYNSQHQQLNYRFNKSSQCYTPKICVGIWKVLSIPKHTDENRAIYKNSAFISQQQISHYYVSAPTTTTSTTANTTADSSPRKPPFSNSTNAVTLATSAAGSNPYRTLSHFGFNSPRQAPRADHKHIPETKENNHHCYKPIRRSISYEEIFATPRYDELCENCFDKLLRLKPELLQYGGRLNSRNQKHSRGSNGGLSSTIYSSHVSDVNAVADYDTYDECTSDTTNGSPPCEQNLLLNTLVEVEELQSSPSPSKGIQAHTQKSVLDHTNPIAAFVKKINRFNFDDESENSNFVPGLRSVSSEITLDDLEKVAVAGDIPKMKPIRPAPPLPPSIPPPPPPLPSMATANNSELTAVAEIWNFGNWQERPQEDTLQPGHQPLTDRRVIFEITQRFDNPVDCCAEMNENNAYINPSTLMSRIMPRDERQRRKVEFQELWEDHIAYFGGAERHEESSKLQSIEVDEFIELNQDPSESSDKVSKVSQGNEEDDSFVNALQPLLVDFEANKQKVIRLCNETVRKAAAKKEQLSCSRLIPSTDEEGIFNQLVPLPSVTASPYDVEQNFEDNRKNVENLEDIEMDLPSATEEQTLPKPPFERQFDTQRNMLELIDQFEKSLSIAGENLNNLVAVVSRQYQTLHDEPDAHINKLTLKDDTHILYHQDTSLSLLPRCTYEEIFPNEEQIHMNSRRSIKTLSVINEEPMKEVEDDNDDDGQSSVCSSSKTYNMETVAPLTLSITLFADDDTMTGEPMVLCEIMEDGNSSDPAIEEGQQSQLTRYITLDDVSVAADEMLTHPEDKSVVTINRSFAESIEHIYSLMEENADESNVGGMDIGCDIQEKQDLESTKENVGKTFDNVENQDCEPENEETERKNSLIEFSPLERKILEKIEEHQLKKSEEIFDKIDQTIRNKFTPSKLKLLVEQQLVRYGINNEIKDDNFEATSTSTPTNQSLSNNPKYFNFGGAFNEYRQVDYYTSDTDNVTRDDGGDDRNQTNLVQPSCSRYVYNAQTQSRLSRSLTPPPKKNRSKLYDSSMAISTRPTGSASCIRRRVSGKFFQQPPSQKRRNFILENIRNAGKPRAAATPKKTQSKEPVKKEATKKYPTSFKSNPEATPCNEMNLTEDHSVYSFQTKGIRGSQRIWVSMPTRSPGGCSSSLDEQQSGKRPGHENSPHVHKRCKSGESNTDSTTRKSPNANTDAKVSSTTFFLPINSNQYTENSQPVVQCSTTNFSEPIRSISSTTFDCLTVSDNQSEDDIAYQSSCYSLNKCPSVMQLLMEEHETVTRIITCQEQQLDATDDTQEASFFSACADPSGGVDAPSEDDNLDNYFPHYNKEMPQTVEDAKSAELITVTSSGYSLQHSTGRTNIQQASTSSLNSSNIYGSTLQQKNNTGIDDDSVVAIDTRCNLRNSVLYITDEMDEQNDSGEQSPTYSSRRESGLTDIDEPPADLQCVDLEQLTSADVEQERRSMVNLNYDIPKSDEIEPESNFDLAGYNRNDQGAQVSLRNTCNIEDTPPPLYSGLDNYEADVMLSCNEVLEIGIGQNIVVQQSLIDSVRSMQQDADPYNENEEETYNAEEADNDLFHDYLIIDENDHNEEECQFEINEEEGYDELEVEEEDNDVQNVSSNEAVSNLYIDESHMTAEDLEVNEVTSMMRAGYDGDDENDEDQPNEEAAGSNDNGSVPMKNIINSNEQLASDPSSKKSMIKIVVELRGSVSGSGNIDDDQLEQPTTSRYAQRLSERTSDTTNRGVVISAATSTNVECAIESLGEEIEQISPRLHNYKRKIDDFGEHVAKCARHMNECITEQEDIAQQQQQFHDNIMLNQYAENISAKVETYSLSETED